MENGSWHDAGRRSFGAVGREMAAASSPMGRFPAHLSRTEEDLIGNYVGSSGGRHEREGDAEKNGYAQRDVS